MEEKQNVFNVIQRLTTQSFAIKGFSFTVIVLVANVFDKFHSWVLLIVGILIVVIFWFLDAYYLTLEKAYRIVYKEYEPNKGMDYRNYITRLKINKSFWNKTVFPIYIAQIILLIVLFLIGVDLL